MTVNLSKLSAMEEGCPIVRWIQRTLYFSVAADFRVVAVAADDDYYCIDFAENGRQKEREFRRIWRHFVVSFPLQLLTRGFCW